MMSEIENRLVELGYWNLADDGHIIVQPKWSRMIDKFLKDDKNTFISQKLIEEYITQHE